MSVTFAVESNTEISSYILSCGCANASSVTFNSDNEVEEFLGKWRDEPFHFDGCEDELCLFYIPSITYIDGTENMRSVNVSNTNARDILEVLGYEQDELCGSATSDDFMGRILIALAIAPESAERVTEVSRSNYGSTIINCGRDAGYIQDRLTDLLDVVSDASNAGMGIYWG